MAGRPRRTRTRIATAHGDTVVIHNGIVENYLALKQHLTAEGHTFVTETDTEVIAHLVEKHSAAISKTRCERRWRRCRACSRWS